MKAGTEALSSKDWGKARRIFEETRAIVLDRLKSGEENLKPMLIALDGDGTLGRPGRIAMAQDYRDRIAGLRAWMSKERIKEGMDADQKRLAFKEIRFDLALNSLPPVLQDAALEAIKEIAEGGDYSEKEHYQITEIIFALIVHILQNVDPDNEDEMIQFCIEIPEDPLFEQEKRVSRSNNQIAVEDRIFAHYNKVKADFNFKDKEKTSQTLAKLISKIFNALGVRKDPFHWASFFKYLKRNGIMPLDLDIAE